MSFLGRETLELATLATLRLPSVERQKANKVNKINLEIKNHNVLRETVV